jgi:ribosomal protein L40E
MGLLSSKEKTLEEKRIDELMSMPINGSVKTHLKQTLKKMAKEGKSISEIDQYYREIVAKTQFIEKRKDSYVTEAKLADEVYKAYVTDGLSRLDKVNGRFLASQSIKTDILIEQNNRIIALLESIINKDNPNLPTSFCPECGTRNNKGAQYCQNCGIKIS